MDRGARLVAVALAAALAGLFSATASRGQETPAASAPARLPGHGPRVFGDHPSVDEMTALGRLAFEDESLSVSGRQSCASCHDPRNHFSPSNALPAQFGGPSLHTPGHRNPPSLMYLQTTIPYTEHYIDDEDGHGIDAGPTGGLTWDGRARSPQEQALIPLFAAHEMGNRDARALAAHVRAAPWAKRFQAAFSGPGENVLDDPAETVAWLASALEVYQQDAATFYPFTSKFDAVTREQAQFTPQEQRGLALYEDPEKGNCASCHPSIRRSDGGQPFFTDTGHIALGVPRNPAIAANRDPRYHDLGLCGPDRTDLKDVADDCGRFKAPTLRNVATRRSFFHNGRFHDLREVVEFYLTRDSDPARWYPRGRDGKVRKFDDLPRKYQGNVNDEAPFEPLPGNKPRMTAAEIDDLVAFLGTLTDAPADAAPAPAAVAKATTK
jgi:cytochrome c peroxidase